LNITVVYRAHCTSNKNDNDDFPPTDALALHRESPYMYEWIKFFHLASAIVWMGGMALVILALRPVVIARMAPPERLALMSAVLSRFFAMVWVSIALLLASGFWMLSVTDMKLAPKGWHAMSALGLLMCLIFAHIWFAPFRRLKAAVAMSDWPAAGKALGQIHPMVLFNFALSWVAVLSVVVWR
jgi:uncharacterized membrane protein